LLKSIPAAAKYGDGFIERQRREYSLDANSSTTVNTTNAEVLKELQLMRARIAELEGQLKAQQGSSGTAAAAGESTSRVTATEPTAANPSPTVASTAQPQVAPEKPEPAAPFAYADWTWLNGTPRNKHAVWTRSSSPRKYASMQITSAASIIPR